MKGKNSLVNQRKKNARTNRLYMKNLYEPGRKFTTIRYKVREQRTTDSYVASYVVDVSNTRSKKITLNPKEHT